MNGPHVVRLRTSLDEPKRPTDVAVDWLSERSKSTIALAASSTLAHLPRPSDQAQDFLAIAIGAYVADRSFVRTDAADGWTRDFRLEVPVSDPDRWNVDTLQKAISFLTGDRWELALRPGTPTPLEFSEDRPSGELSEVALFSGGVDSLTGAAEAVRAGHQPILISHYGDSPTATLQQTLATQILGSEEALSRLIQFRLTSAPAADPNATGYGFPDTTMRSRSLLFIALGITIASSMQVSTLRLAENGYIAINVPLHAGRAGSLSTRTAHPHFLDTLSHALHQASLAIDIKNPFLLLTKGQVTQRLLATRAAPAARSTVSCAHPIGRWQSEGYRNCGYCYPCLIRQAGFHAAGADSTAYSIDPFTDTRFYSERQEATSDIRSLARALLDDPSPNDILDVAPVPSPTLLSDLHEMRTRGLNELQKLFDSRLSTTIRSVLGL